MKKIVMAFVAASCLLCGCSDDNTDGDSARATISITPDALPAEADGTTAQVTVTSSGDWRLAGVCDWAHPSSVSGKSGDTVTFTIDPNTTEQTREATFKFFTGSAVAPLRVTSRPSFGLELLSDAEMTFEAGENAFRVKVHTTIPELEYAFTDGGEKWLHFQERTEVFGNTMLAFALDANPDYDDRTTELTVLGMGRSVKVAIRQRQIDAIQVEPENLEYDLTAQNFSVEVKANVEYDVQIDVDWITRVETRGLVSETLRFHVDEATAARVGTVTISGGGIRKVVSVLQKDPNAKKITIPDDAFREWLAKEGWVIDLGNAICLVTEKGLQATEFVYHADYWTPAIETLEGIDAFPELRKIDLYGNDLTSIDLSGLTKVATLECASMVYLEKIVAGSNPIAELSFESYMYTPTMTISGEKITRLNMSCESWAASWDELQTIDASGCTALQTLDCKRAKLKTVYLRTGSTATVNKNDATAIEYK